MHLAVKKLNIIKNKVNEIIKQKQLKCDLPTIIAVSKTFPISDILPLVESGHSHFGENKVQEAEVKWLDLKRKNKNIKLHLLGKLQTNKVKKAIKIFDYIHSLDNEKLAQILDKCQNEINFKVKIFIQINLANEKQKSGISINKVKNFYDYCTKDLSLDIIGLMCLPPFNENSEKYFEMLKSTSESLNLRNLSMGMSNDFTNAILYGATHLRLGTAIFGERKN